MATLRPKKILQVTTFFAPVVGGVETQVEDLAEKLLEREYEVEVLTTDSGRGKRRLDRGRDEVHGIPITRVRTWFSFSQFHKFAPGFWGQLQKKDFDVVHVHGLRKPELYLALFAAKLKGKRIVASTHNPFTTVDRSRFMKFFIFFHDVLVGFWLMRFVDHYFLLSQTEIPILKKFGIKENNMTVVGNAVADEFYEEVETDRAEFLANLFEQKEREQRQWKGIVLGVGRMNKVKGFQNLHKAIKELPEVLFLIVGGDDGYKSQLLELYGDMENVILSDAYLSREQLLKYYAHADIFVLPSLHEPFGIVLVEAMAEGCAIIASNNGGPVDILEGNKDVEEADYGILVNSEDQDAWLKWIHKLISHPKLLKEQRNKSKERSKKYSWRRILSFYLSVYEGSL